MGEGGREGETQGMRKRGKRKREDRSWLGRLCMKEQEQQTQKESKDSSRNEREWVDSEGAVKRQRNFQERFRAFWIG